MVFLLDFRFSDSEPVVRITTINVVRVTSFRQLQNSQVHEPALMAT